MFSPTSSGKTFVGEMAAVKAARENTKVFYLVPQKALAAEKFEELSRRYDPVGIKVVVSSRDRREFDQETERRDFQIAIVVFEKLQALLVGKPQLMEAVGLVVIEVASGVPTSMSADEPLRPGGDGVVRRLGDLAAKRAPGSRAYAKLTKHGFVPVLSFDR